MRKRSGIIKQILSLGLIFLLSINSFAIEVNDNDGSAFITKAEFDALKSSFQSQIDTYNQSIDSKIDNAIAAYLSGIGISKFISLDLDHTLNYSFPLRYETYKSNQSWNDNWNAWFCVPIPAIYQQKYGWYDYLGCINGSPGPKSGWVINMGSDVQPGVVRLATKSVLTSDGLKFGMHCTNVSRMAFDGHIGLLNLVEKNNAGRNIVANTLGMPTGLSECTWKLVSTGHGKEVIQYAPNESVNIVIGSYANLLNQATPNNHTYSQTLLHMANYQDGSNGWIQAWADCPDWTKFQFWSGRMGNHAAGTYIVPLTWNKYESPVSFTNLHSYLKYAGQNGSGNILSADTHVLDESTTYSDNSTNFIFGRGAYMPANKTKLWRLKAQINTSKSVAQFVNIQDSTPHIEDMYTWTMEESTTPHAGVNSGTAFILPRVIAAPNKKSDGTADFACAAADAFSQLPSTLVSYIDDKGYSHWMDEGMFLGNMPKTGIVSFLVKFHRDAGSGTQVKLHISKKPFAYNFNNTDLTIYKINDGIATTEQNLNYDTVYEVKIDNVNTDDQLYMEWIPAQSGDQVALQSFSNYQMEVSQ